MAEADRDSVIIEQAIGDAQIEAQKAAERMPNNDTWGFFSFGDGPPAAGGGVGGFLWFDDRAGMLDFIRRHLTYFSPGPTKSDPQTVNAADVSLVWEFESGNVGEMGTFAAQCCSKGLLPDQVVGGHSVSSLQTGQTSRNGCACNSVALTPTKAILARLLRQRSASFWNF